MNSRHRKAKEAQALVSVTEKAQAASRERLRVTMDRYQSQAALLKDVLQDEAALADANRQHLQALLSFSAALADLEKAVGGE